MNDVLMGIANVATIVAMAVVTAVALWFRRRAKATTLRVVRTMDEIERVLPATIRDQQG